MNNTFDPFFLVKNIKQVSNLKETYKGIMEEVNLSINEFKSNFKLKSSYLHKNNPNHQQLDKINSLILNLKNDFKSLSFNDKNISPDKIDHYNKSVKNLNLKSIDTNKTYSINEILKILKTERNNIKAHHKNSHYPTVSIENENTHSIHHQDNINLFTHFSRPYTTNILCNELACKKEDLTIKNLNLEKELQSSKLQAIYSNFKHMEYLYTKLKQSVPDLILENCKFTPIENISDEQLINISESALKKPDEHNQIQIVSKLQSRLKELIPSLDKCCEKIQLIDNYRNYIEKSTQLDIR